jgi:hypothetical protein
MKTTLRLLLLPALFHLTQYSLSLASTADTAEVIDFGAIPAGNVLASPEAIAKLARAKLIEQFKGVSNGTDVTLNLGSRNADLKFPDTNADLLALAKVLGVDGTFKLDVQDLKVKLQLPLDNLKFGVRAVSTNHFKIQAKWLTPKVSLLSSGANISVPIGLFPKPFLVKMSGFQVSVKRKSLQFQTPSIAIHAILDMEVTKEGVKTTVESIETNLEEFDPKDFTFKLGAFTVDQKPIHFEMETNQTILQITNQSIQTTLEKNKTSLVKALQKLIKKSLIDVTETLSHQMRQNPPLQYTIQLTGKNLQNQNPPIATSSGYGFNPKPAKLDIQPLIEGITIQAIPTYLQSLKKSRLLSLQISTINSIHDQPLKTTVPNIVVDDSDIRKVDSGSDIAFLFQESWLQNWIHSDTIQDRLVKWLKPQIKSKGILLAKNPIRIHFNPKTNSIALVVNFKIDLYKTIKEDAGLAERIRLSLGDWLERNFGAGDYIQLPVEINLRYKDTSKKSQILADSTFKSINELNFTPELPFQEDAILNTYRYPSNLNEMTPIVRKGLIETLKNELEAIVPANVAIPIGTLNIAEGMAIKIKQLVITPNHSLLMSTQLQSTALQQSLAELPRDSL